jgi:hypothetical protein
VASGWWSPTRAFASGAGAPQPPAAKDAPRVLDNGHLEPAQEDRPCAITTSAVPFRVLTLAAQLPGGLCLRTSPRSRAAAESPACFRRGEAGLRPFRQPGPLVFCKGCEHAKDELAVCAGGIEPRLCQGSGTRYEGLCCLFADSFCVVALRRA